MNHPPDFTQRQRVPRGASLAARLAAAYRNLAPAHKGKSRVVNAMHMAWPVDANAPSRRLVRLTTGGWIVVDRGSYLGEKIYQTGIHEKQVTNLIQELVVPGSVVFDVGAHVGYFTILCGPLVGPTGQVHSFEADKRIFDELTANIVMNGMSHAHPNNAVVIDTTGTVEFYLDSKVAGGVGGILRTERSEAKPVLVSSVSLDDYVKANQINRVDFVKIDVEGAELKVLRGMRDIIERFSPIVICELGEAQFNALNYTSDRLFSYMHQFAYEGYVIENAGEVLPYALFSMGHNMDLPKWTGSLDGAISQDRPKGAAIESRASVD